VLSWVVIFLMAIHVIETTFLLSFLVYGGSVAGLFMGLKGTFEYMRIKKSEKEEDKESEEKEEKFRDWYK